MATLQQLTWFDDGGTETGAMGTDRVPGVQLWSLRGCGNLLASSALSISLWL